ncbi:hypothetical protein B0T13DRAFT_519001 [Neurospora crassa]|nr:hypothetical protein B0T13DRAFT_519001 [Neurospora crassa]
MKETKCNETVTWTSTETDMGWDDGWGWYGMGTDGLQKGRGGLGATRGREVRWYLVSNLPGPAAQCSEWAQPRTSTRGTLKRVWARARGHWCGTGRRPAERQAPPKVFAPPTKLQARNRKDPLSLPRGARNIAILSRHGSSADTILHLLLSLLHCTGHDAASGYVGRQLLDSDGRENTVMDCLELPKWSTMSEVCGPPVWFQRSGQNQTPCKPPVSGKASSWPDREQ